ncbi:uncharacterized protein TNCV_4442961 [Trichonephila clavipes]|nr:uncharacterized protein TNCV_4442961 [Trichonephila clavipes]
MVDFHKRILFSDEAHFWLNGYVNKQNCRIWSEDNPQVPENWPPRSCDLTPLDYFLWGYVMSLVHADKPQTLDHLEDNIRRVIADIRPQMLVKVIENWTSRLDYIRARRGSPMPEIIFKIKDQSHENLPTASCKTKQRLKVLKWCRSDLKTAGEGTKSAFYLLVLRSLLIKGPALFLTLTCVRCSASQASPEHILDCPGLSNQDLYEDPLMVLDFLRVNEIMDLV